MGVKVHVDLTKFHKKFSQQALRRGRLAAANDAHQAMERYVPKLSGDLRKHSKISVDGTQIIYTMPYAKAQFYGLIGPRPGYPVKHYTTPGTSKRWDLRLLANKRDIKKVKEAFINGAEWNK